MSKTRPPADSSGKSGLKGLLTADVGTLIRGLLGRGRKDGAAGAHRGHQVLRRNRYGRRGERSAHIVLRELGRARRDIRQPVGLGFQSYGHPFGDDLQLPRLQVFRVHPHT